MGRLQWRSIDVIHDIDVPLLLLSSDKDEIVPKVHMHRLSRAAKTAELHTFPDATHNDIFHAGGRRYWAIKGDFIERVIRELHATPIARSQLEAMTIAGLKELAIKREVNI